MSNLNKKILLFVMLVGVAFGLVGCSNPDNSVRIYFNEDAYEVRLNETKVIEPTIIKSSQVGDVELVYSSSDESIVKVENGVIVPVAMGEATIKVAWADKDIIFDKAVVKVTKAALPQAVLNFEAAMLKGAEQTVSVSLGNNLTEATYSFSALTPEVATIDEAGLVKAVAVGTAKFEVVVADYEESETVEFEIVVEESDFAIKYNLDGGQNHEENPIGYNALALPLPLKEASKVGYTFLGWYNAADEKVEEIAAGTLGDVEVTAKWQVNEYTIKFNGVEGAAFEAGYELPSVYTVESDEIVFAAPTKVGYKFLGWFAGEEQVEKIAKGSIGNVEVEAKWEVVKYSISYTTAHGELPGYATIDEAIADFLADYNKARNKSHTAETFAALGSWSEISDASLFLYSADYRAKWAWLVDYIAEYAGKANKPAYQNFNKYNSQKELNAANGNYIYEVAYELRGWVGQFKYTKNGNFHSGDYSVEATQKAMFDYCGVANSYTIESETIVLPVLEENGYTFLGWYNAADEKVEEIAKGSTGDVAVTAKWEIVTYDITLNLDGGEFTGLVSSHQDIVKEFLKDFSAFSKTTIDTPAAYWNSSAKTSFWKNAEMHAKWSWIFEYLMPLAKKQGESTDYLANMLKETPSVSGYATQNVAIFLLQANSTIWNSDYKATYGGLSSKWTTVDCTGVTFESYVSYLPAQFPQLKTEYTVLDTIALPTPVKEDHVFLGWYAGETKVESIELGSYGDVELTAKWHKIIRYPLTWNLDGGKWDDVEGAVEFKEGEYASVVLPTPVKAYHKFLGWFVGEEKVEKLSADQAYELTAKWEDLRINGGTQFVLFQLEGGNWKDGEIPGVDVTEYVEVLKLVPVRFGYKFAGWNVETDNSTDPVTIIYTATWEEVVKYSISYVLEGGENAESNPTQYTSETLPLVLAPATKVGYEFAGWFDGETEVKEIVAGTTGDLVLTAKWVSSAIEVTLNGNGGVVPGAQASYDEIAAEFLADFNKYGNVSLTATDFASGSSSAVKVVFANAEMLAKWAWFFEFALADLKAAYPDETNEYLVNAYPALEEFLKGEYKVITGDATVGGPNARTMIRNYIGGMLQKQKGDASNTVFQAFATDFADVARQEALVAASPCKTVFAFQAGTELPTPTKEGYTFLGWYNAEGVQVTTAEAGLVATAKWEITSDGPFQIEYELNGGEFAEITYENGVSGEAYNSFEIGKFYADGLDYTEPVVICESSITSKNSLRWQKKLLLVYKEELGAYEVVAADGATAGANALGVEWTHALASTTVDVHTYAGVGQLIVLDGEVSAEMGATGAKVYAPDQITSQPVKTPIAAPATYSKADLPLALPTPVKDGAEFAGWLLNGEAFDGTLTEKLGDIKLVATWK